MESKQKELQSLQHDKSCLEQQLSNLVGTAGHSGFLSHNHGLQEIRDLVGMVTVRGRVVHKKASQR